MVKADNKVAKPDITSEKTVKSAEKAGEKARKRVNRVLVCFKVCQSEQKTP